VNAIAMYVSLKTITAITVSMVFRTQFFLKVWLEQTCKLVIS